MDTFVFDNERWSRDCIVSMRRQRYSYRTLAQKLPISSAHINKLFNGLREPKMSVFIIICAVLGLSAIEYFDIDEVQMKMFQ